MYYNASSALLCAVSFAPKILQTIVNLGLRRVVIQCLAEPAVMHRWAAEIAVLIEHSVVGSPPMILQQLVLVFVQVLHVIGQCPRIHEILVVQIWLWRQEFCTIAPTRAEHHGYGQLRVSLPKHLLRQVLATIGVLKGQVELVIVEQWAIHVKVARTGAGVAAQAASKNREFVAQRCLQPLHVSPSLVVAAAITAEHRHQFALWPEIGKGQLPRLRGQWYCSPVGHRHVAVAAIAHRPVEQPIVVAEILRLQQKRVEGRLVREEYPSLPGITTHWWQVTRRLGQMQVKQNCIGCR